MPRAELFDEDRKGKMPVNMPAKMKMIKLSQSEEADAVQVSISLGVSGAGSELGNWPQEAGWDALNGRPRPWRT